MTSKRPRHAGNRRRFLVVIALVIVGTMGCGDDPMELVYEPDFMVGEWLAESLVVTSVANPEVTADLTALGLVFTLSVQPSGRYTAIWEGFGSPFSQIGRLTVDGAEVVLIPQSPPGEESRAVWERVGESVILVGEADFDFDLDGTTEAGTRREVLIPN